MKIFDRTESADIKYLSLGQQVLCVLFLFGAIFGGAALYSSSIYEKNYAHKQLMHQSERVLSFISAGSMEAIISEDIPVLETLVTMVMSADPEIIHIRILNETGLVLMEKKTFKTGEVEEKIKFQNDIILEGEKFGTIELYWDVVSFSAHIVKQSKRIILLEFLIVIILTMSFFITIQYIIIKPITRINRKLLKLAVYSQSAPLVLSKYTAIEFQNLAESVNSLQQSFMHREEILSDLEIAKDKAEASNEAKNKFLAVMSHEIRTPINGIMGMSEMLRKSNLNTEDARHINIIKHSANDLMEIVDDILDFSSIEKNKFNLHEVSFPLNKLIAELDTHFSLKANRKNLSFHVRVADFPQNEIYGDRQHLRQTLINLLSNAFKFTSQGEVNLEINSSMNKGGNLDITFNVMDTGIGIAPCDQHKIFDEFKQLNEGFRRRYNGLGLGLALSQRIIKKMGGTLTVKSKLGAGSIFSFTLSFRINQGKIIFRPKQINKIKKNNQYQNVNITLKNIKKQHILLVEDSLTNQEVVLAMLKDTRYDVAIVMNGKEALEYLSHKSTNRGLKAILMDISTPEMDGVTATEYIRKLDGQISHIPIIALTAHVFQNELDHFIASGMDDYLAKPVSRKDLLATLSRWIPQIH